MFDFYKSLSDANQGNFWNVKPDKMEADLVCPKCSTHESDFLETGYLGCPYCYKVFATSVVKYAQDIHGKREHVGKMPLNQFNRKNKSLQLQQLLKQKEEAIASENFELAAILKEKIEKLMGEI